MLYWILGLACVIVMGILLLAYGLCVMASRTDDYMDRILAELNKPWNDPRM